MASKVFDPRQVIDSRIIPDGQFYGTWGGYLVRFKVGDDTIEARSQVGIRTVAASCVVTVKNGEMSVEVD